MFSCVLTPHGVLRELTRHAPDTLAEAMAGRVGHSVLTHLPFRVLRRFLEVAGADPQGGTVSFDYAPHATPSRAYLAQVQLLSSKDLEVHVRHAPPGHRAEKLPTDGRKPQDQGYRALRDLKKLRETKWTTFQEAVGAHLRVVSRHLQMDHALWLVPSSGRWRVAGVSSPAVVLQQLEGQIIADGVADAVAGSGRPRAFVKRAAAPPLFAAYGWSRLWAQPVRGATDLAGVMVWFDDAPEGPSGAPPVADWVAGWTTGVADSLLRHRAEHHPSTPADTNYYALLEAISDGAALHNYGRVLYANAALQRMLAAPGALTHRRVGELVQDASLLAATDGRPTEGETKGITADGRVLDLMVTTTLYPHAGEHVCLTIFRDLSAQKRQEAHREEAQRAAAAMIRTREEFVSMVVHELRTPLNTVVGMTHLLLEEPLTPTQMEYLNAVKYSSDSLLGLINDILDFNKIASGNIWVEAESFALNELVGELHNAMRRRAEEKDLTLQLHYDEAIPPYLLGDSLRLNQVLLNLVNNAVKFTERGGVTLAVEQLHRTDGGVRLRFRVSDTGIGIPAERQAAVFESYQQAGADTSRKYGGTGLGLAICKQLVELQGGHIRLESEPGVGSEFSFDLFFPLGEAPTPVEIKEDAAQQIKSVRLLVVEDNAFNRMVAGRFLEKWGVTADVVEDGYAALGKVEKERYDMVLMDIHLPGIDGWETTRRLRAHPDPQVQNLPVVAMTASFGTPTATWQAKELGIEQFVGKPFVPDELFAVIARYAPMAAEEGAKDPTAQPEASVSTVDLSYLRSLSGNSDEFLQQALEMFLKQMETFDEQLRLAARHHDREKYRFNVHKLKSAFGTLQVEAFKKITADLESTDLEGVPFTVIQDKINRLLALNERTRREVAAHRDALQQEATSF
ncbi:MAG: ATP-binding protein [Catalinimonas sp.]